MTSILSGLHTVQQALTTQQFALSVTQKNVANANNPHYTRQDAIFHPDWAAGNGFGVPGVSLQAARDHYIDYGISKELQLLGESGVRQNTLGQIDAVITAHDGWGLQQALSHFFNSFSLLSGAPEDLHLRQQVITSAEALTREFQRIFNGIQSVQHSLDRQAGTTVDEINRLTAGIADLNGKLAVAEATRSSDAYTLRDERQRTVEQLAGLIDIAYFETESGAMTVTTRQGKALVLENQHRPLERSTMAAGTFSGVSLAGEDITGSIQSGSLGGMIELRDRILPGYLDVLDAMASAIVSRINEVHAQGTDLDGNSGSDFFSPFVSVRTMSVDLTDPRQIAAAGLGAGPGNNDNAKLLAAIGDEKLLASSTKTVHQVYAELLYTVGAAARSAEDTTVMQNNLLNQLKNQRSAFTGVDLNEQAVQLIKYQKAYQASARYAAVLDDLSNEILNFLGR